MYEQGLVVKVGGSIAERSALLTELVAYPGPLVVVHGGGPAIGAHLERLGMPTRFIAGERVTPAEQVAEVEMVLTRLGKVMAHELSRAGRLAIGVSGRDAGFLRARPKAELGRVGELVAVATAFLRGLLEKGLTPVVSPIAVDEEGALNVNADFVAAEIAGALGWPVAFFTDVPGVLLTPGDASSLVREVSIKEVTALVESGVVSGGMVAKVRAAVRAVAAGAPWSAIAGADTPLSGVLRGEFGTRVV